MTTKYNIRIYNNDILNKEYLNINSMKNNKITFKLDNIKTIINNNILIRENEEFKFEIDLLNKKATYLLKEKNYLYDIEVKKSYIQYDNNKIIIIYNIETNEEEIKIVLERCE